MSVVSSYSFQMAADWAVGGIYPFASALRFVGAARTAISLVYRGGRGRGAYFLTLQSSDMRSGIPSLLKNMRTLPIYSTLHSMQSIIII